MNPNDERERWYFTKEQLEDSPSRRLGLEADKELSQRQQAANFIQDMGQRLHVTQLCINTAIVYMHRFYCFHSFTHFHRNSISAAAIFLAAKVEEQPRKLEHIIKVAQMCLLKTSANDRRTDEYLAQAQELVVNENILLMTLGFDVAIEHPHAFIVKFCHIANASKDLSQTSYFMASNSLHLTTMCLQYKPTVVACFCIHLSCQWSRWQIPKSKENLPWYSYIDQSVTEELLEQLTHEFLVIFDKCPSRLKKKIQNCQHGQNSYMFEPDRKYITNYQQQHGQTSSSSSSKPGTSSSALSKPGTSSMSLKPVSNSSSSSRPVTSSSSSVVNGSRIHPASSSVAHESAANKLPNASNPVIPPTTVKSSSSHAPPPFGGSSLQQHPYKSTNPHTALSNSAINKPHHSAPAVSSNISVPNHVSTGSGSHNVFTKDVSQRVEQMKKPPMDVKHRPSTSSALPPSMAVNSTHCANKPAGLAVENTRRKESVHVSPALHVQPPPLSSRPSFASSQSDIISNVVKEVAAKQQAEKQRLISTVKSEPIDEDVKPSLENANLSKTSKSHSIFSPSPVGNDDSVKSSPFEDVARDTSTKTEPLSPPDAKKARIRNMSSSSGERELIPIVKKVDDVVGFEDIFKKSAVSVSDFEASPKQEPRDGESSTNESSHAHKKKKKHKEKDKKHDKEKRHKEKKKHKDDKHKKEHKEKKPSKEQDPPAPVVEAVQERVPERIKITIPKDRLNHIPTKPKEKERAPDAPVKLKINLNNQMVTPAVGDAESELKLKISKDKVKSRKRHHESVREESSKKCAFNGGSSGSLNNGYTERNQNRNFYHSSTETE